MLYVEYLPKSTLSRHVECFWELDFAPDDLRGQFEMLSPDCTYDIIFSTENLSFRPINASTWQKIPTGAAFMGQRTSSIQYKVTRPVKIFGIRFKPFAFWNLIPFPLYKLNDKAFSLTDIFEITPLCNQLIKRILSGSEVQAKMELSEQLMLNISKDNLIVDPMLRDQVNYILERKGILRVNEMYSEFGISKVGLRNNFINKIGLTPKKVSQIWRLNYFLYLQQNTSCQNLTQLGLDAGFYDQAHFIKEFKSFFHCSPLHFFKNEHHLLKISQETISKRLFNVYDPVN
ncbi:MAG: AraC family transcriptional regulator [Saprospiraceae bacterium]|nr:AraC family transcriptional regulator [Saprospiraceae bacterium]MCB9322825.1 AraC family transcriptional regulator [Lewinellaceae bacterium]